MCQALFYMHYPLDPLQQPCMEVILFYLFCSRGNKLTGASFQALALRLQNSDTYLFCNSEMVLRKSKLE